MRLNVTVHLCFTLNQTKNLSAKCVLLSCANWIALRTHNKIVPTTHWLHTAYSHLHTRTRIHKDGRKKERKKKISGTIVVLCACDAWFNRSTAIFERKNKNRLTDECQHTEIERRHDCDFFFSNEICRNGPKCIHTHKHKKWHDVIYIFIVHTLVVSRKKIVL